MTSILKMHILQDVASATSERRVKRPNKWIVTGVLDLLYPPPINKKISWERKE